MLASWFVASGAVVKADEVVGSIETDKVTVEVRSPFAGKIIETFSAEGDEINVGEPLFVIQPMEESETAAVAVAVSAPVSVPVSTPAAVTPTKSPTPAPTQVKAAPTPTPTKTAAPTKPSTPTPTPALKQASGSRGETRVKMTRMRLRIAQRLKEAQNTTAMLTTFQVSSNKYVN